MINKRKFLVINVVLFILCISMIALPISFAKYVSGSTGIAWQTYFTKFDFVSENTFVIKDGNSISKHIWGQDPDEDGDGKISDPGLSGGNYSIQNAVTREFNVYNDSDTPMVVNFLVMYCTPDFGSTALKFTIKNNFTNESFTGSFVKAAGNPIVDSEVVVEMASEPSYSRWAFVTIDYYLFTAKIETKNILNSNVDVLENSFVLQQGESSSYSIEVDFSGVADYINLGSCYATIRMTVEPYIS